MAVETLDDAVQDWLTRMQELGVIPKESRRIIIDIPMRGRVKVYVEYWADLRMLIIEMADMLKGIEPIGVKDVAAPHCAGKIQPTRPFPPPPAKGRT